MKKITAEQTERDAIEEIILLIEKYQDVEGWSIGIREDGVVDAVNDSFNTFDAPRIAVEYYYTTSQPEGFDEMSVDEQIEYFMADGKPENDEYEIDFLKEEK